MGPHTTSDDPGRYRSEDRTAEWRERDPLKRVQHLFTQAGEWSADWHQSLETRAAERIEAAVEEAESLPQPTRAEMFHRMYSEITPPLLDQLGESSDG
jgi:pyruvate dehydrogenase E1 component alpha subunit